MIINGKALAAKREEILKVESARISGLIGRQPCLSVVLVGDDPASRVYVSHKEKACERVGIKSEIIRLPADTSEEKLREKISQLNSDDSVDGFFVQFPLPDGLKDYDPTLEIDKKKDVDGLAPENLGLMLKSSAYSEPCTPSGVIHLLKENNIEMSGKKAVVVGRSLIVGWPMVWMLTRENATVTVCHSRTQNLEESISDADIIVVAAGKPKFLDKSHFKSGATVIDVGVHRVEGKLVGDVNTEGFEEKEINFSPVPGGVGPMTVSLLLQNLLGLARKNIGN